MPFIFDWAHAIRTVHLSVLHAIKQCIENALFNYIFVRCMRSYFHENSTVRADTLLSQLPLLKKKTVEFYGNIHELCHEHCTYRAYLNCQSKSLRLNDTIICWR